MLEMSESKRHIIDLMIQMLGGVSVFVSFVLGFLIVFANNFFNKKKEKRIWVIHAFRDGKRRNF